MKVIDTFQHACEIYGVMRIAVLPQGFSGRQLTWSFLAHRCKTSNFIGHGLLRFLLALTQLVALAFSAESQK